MKPSLRRVLALALALPLLSAGDGDEELQLGRKYLGTRMPKLAARKFREILDEHPGDPSATIGLARALGQMGLCEDSLSLLQPLRTSRQWNAKVSVAEADCLARVGRHQAAIAAYEEALAIKPDLPQPVYGLVLETRIVGELHASQFWLSKLGTLPRGEAMTWLALAETGLEGGAEDFEIRLFEATSAVDAADSLLGLAQIVLLDAMRWMDVGDPQRAVTLLEGSQRTFGRHMRLAAYHAEALRRTGYPEDGLAVLEDPRLPADSARLDRVVRSRILIDLGDTDGAERLLAPMRSSDDAEVIASLWYLARATSDAEGAERYASHWQDTSFAADRSLEQLIPFAEVPR